MQEINLSLYNIGNLLLDEVHCLIGPDKFSQLCHVVNCKYVFAMSATPKVDEVYNWLGDIVVGDRLYSVSPTVVSLNYPSSYKRYRIR